MMLKREMRVKTCFAKIYKTYQNGIRSHLWTHIFPTKELSAKKLSANEMKSRTAPKAQWKFLINLIVVVAVG
jgi:hypothetical protein